MGLVTGAPDGESLSERERAEPRPSGPRSARSGLGGLVGAPRLPGHSLSLANAERGGRRTDAAVFVSGSGCGPRIIQVGGCNH